MMFLRGGHLACSSHKPLTSSYSPVTKRLQAGQDQGFRIVYPAKYYVGVDMIFLIITVKSRIDLICPSVHVDYSSVCKLNTV